MNDTRVTNKEFEKRWKNHIDELTSLGWNLNEEDYEDLKELQGGLKELVKKAVDNRVEEDEEQ